MTVRTSPQEVRTACGDWHDTGTGRNKTYDQSWRADCGKCRKRSQIQQAGWKPPRIHVKPWKRPADRPYQPGQYDAGQPITYTRTDSQRAEGITHTGIIWSAGPNPHSVWVSPDDYPRSFAHMTLVVIPKDDSQLPWVTYGGYPSPKSMTTLVGTEHAHHGPNSRTVTHNHNHGNIRHDHGDLQPFHAWHWQQDDALAGAR